MQDDGRRRRTRPLEATEVSRAKAPRRRAKPSAPEERGLVALVVDDEEDVREWLRLSLSLEGWTVEEATSGAEAIEMWRATMPDVVLLDQRLRGMSGLECAAQLRLLSGDTRIILVTAHLDEWATKEARRLRLLPLEKADSERLFQLLTVLAEQVRTSRSRVV